MSQGLDILQYFKYSHLPKDLQVVSKPFSDMAQVIATLPSNPECTVSLRKLLESKDAAVRAAMAVPTRHPIEDRFDKLLADSRVPVVNGEGQVIAIRQTLAEANEAAAMSVADVVLNGDAG